MKARECSKIKPVSAEQPRVQAQGGVSRKKKIHDSDDLVWRRWLLSPRAATAGISSDKEVSVVLVESMSGIAFRYFPGDYTDGLLYSMRRRSIDSVTRRGAGVSELPRP